MSKAHVDGDCLGAIYKVFELPQEQRKTSDIALPVTESFNLE